jgi:uncharacterized membrane protein
MENKDPSGRIEYGALAIGRTRIMWFFWPFLIILATVFCVAALYSAMCCMTHHQKRTADILKERLARGEITEAQFKEQRRLLEG